MDWVDEISIRTYTNYPVEPPGYWKHPLVHHLGLPDQWPIRWSSLSHEKRLFVLTLENFCPPSNLEGIYHLLPAMAFIMPKFAPEGQQTAAKDILGDFNDQTMDFIRHHALNDERRILKSRKLHGIKKLGIWRFHFHTSQINRAALNNLLNHRISNRLVNSNQLTYYTTNHLDQIYKLLAVEIHKCLRRRFRDKLRSTPSSVYWCDRAKLVYQESLYCEHTLQIAYKLLDGNFNSAELKPEDALMKDMESKLKDRIRYFHRISNLPDQEKEIALVKTTPILQHFISPISKFHTLLGSRGSYSPRKKRRISKFELTKNLRRTIGKLLPPGIFSSEADDAVVIHDETFLDAPLYPTLGIPDDKLTQVNFSRHYGLSPAIAFFFGESPDDYSGSSKFEIPATWLSDPYLTAIKHKVQMESAILSVSPPIWSSRCMMVPTIQNYLTVMKRRSTAIQFISMIALYSGLDENEIFNMHLGIPSPIRKALSNHIEDLDDDTFRQLRAFRNHGVIYLDPEREFYVYALDEDKLAYFDKKETDFTDDCHPGSFLVPIQLPEPVRIVLNCWRQDEPSRLNHSYGGPVPLFHDWKKLINDWTDMLAEVGRISSENITMARIHATFRALFVGQMKLPELYANLISRNIPLQNRSQHFYANMHASQINQAYAHAATTIHKLLQPDPQNSAVSSPPHSIPEPRIGSRLVPDEHLKQYFAELHASFALQLENSCLDCDSWNRLVVFVYRLLQLSLGIRPIRDTPPTWDDISFDLGWIRISDKNNLHYYESRIIPLPTTLRAWMLFLRNLQPHAFLDLNLPLSGLAGINTKSACRDAFVTANTDSNMLCPFQYDDIDKVESGIALATPWRWKANALRHNMLSRLIDEGIDQVIIDFIMGHKHFGREPFGRFSLIDPISYSQQVIDAIDRYVVASLEIPMPPDDVY